MDDLLQEPPAPDRARQLGSLLRAVSQLVGLGLILIGAYYSLHILAHVLRVTQDPSGIDGAVAGMAQAIGADGLVVPTPTEKVPIGKPVSAVVLLLWNLVSAWIALGLLIVGGRLAAGPINERREFLAAMKEFLVTLRQQGNEPTAKKNA